MIKQILDFNKKAFDDSFNAVVTVQEHAEKMARIFFEKSSFFPEEGKKIVEDWVHTYRNGLDEFRTNVDSRFELVEKYLLCAADQMESSFNTIVKPAGQYAAADDQLTKKVAADLNAAAKRKPPVRKEKISRRKTGKQ
jgi:polyhydroxyalkanoate synthesis regulator phasin